MVNRIASGIQQEWFADGHATMYTLTDLAVVSLVPLSESICTAVADLSAQHPCMGLLLDISAPGVAVRFLTLTGQNIYNIGLTPMGQQRIRAQLQARPNFRVYVSVVVSNSPSGKITSARTRRGDTSEQIVAQLFQERTSAIQWLVEQVSV